MSDLMRAFLDGMLLENPAFMSYVGALVVVVLPRSARRSLEPAMRFSLVFFFAALVGGVSAGSLPENALGPLFEPLVYVFVGGGAIGILYRTGDLTGAWMGMPTALLALAPVIGLQVLLAGAGDLSRVVAGAAGNALGFGAAFIVIGAIRESSRISETTETFKTNPVVLFSMAVFALIMKGFLFW